MVEQAPRRRFSSPVGLVGLSVVACQAASNKENPNLSTYGTALLVGIGCKKLARG